METLIKITTGGKRDKYDYTSGWNPRQITNPKEPWDEGNVPQSPPEDSDRAISSKTVQGKS